MRRHLYDELQQSKPETSLAEEVYLEIRLTAELSGRWCIEAMKPMGLSLSQFNVLRILRGALPGSLPAGRIAERMVNRDPDLTRLLDRLEGAGYVEKARSAHDRRVVDVRITQAGLDVVRRASEAVRTRLQAEMGALGERRLAQLADLLEQIRHRAAPPSPAPPPRPRGRPAAGRSRRGAGRSPAARPPRT
jgi:DNA-binding MarR family transcriptional regulator